MDTAAVTAELAKPIARELLTSSVPARLAYTGRDGDPRVIPVGYAFDGQHFRVASPVKSAKLAALRMNPRVAITIDTDSYPPRVLLVRGAAAVDVVDGVPDFYVEGAHRIVPEEAFAGWEAGVRALYAQMGVITITPDWAKLLDFETTIPKAVADLVAAHGDPR
jgi:Pyridoxamine 5'-phosphate oxidase